MVKFLNFILDVLNIYIFEEKNQGIRMVGIHYFFHNILQILVLFYFCILGNDKKAFLIDLGCCIVHTLEGVSFA